MIPTEAQTFIKHMHEANVSLAEIIETYPDLAASEVEEYVKGCGNGHLPEFTLSDVGNSERFVRDYQGHVLYCPDRKLWLVWNGKHWAWDEAGAIIGLAEKTAKSIYLEAHAESNPDRAKDIGRHAIKSEAEVRIVSMVSLAESKLPVRIAQLNANPWLLNAANGTVNLKTGELQPHSPADLITVCMDVVYVPEALSADGAEWEAFLARIFTQDKTVIEFVKRFAGYSATGSQEEQVFVFLHGAKGFNGKSQLIKALRRILGPYAAEVPPSAFMSDKHEKGPNEAIASLYRARFCAATEVEDGQRLNYSLLKRMTGGESLRCERKFEHGFDFEPEYKLWLSGNHEPKITDTTNSIWNRVRKIPFLTVIPENERIKDYGAKLAAEHGEAILAWLVAGCLAWQREGLGYPDTIKNATAQYRASQDKLAEFLTECCHLGVTDSVTVADLYKAYAQWCEENKQYPLSKSAFGDRLREKDLVSEKGGHGGKMTWRGIRLLTLQEQVETVELVELDDTKSGKPLRENYIEKVPQNMSTNSTNSTTVNLLMDNCPMCGKCEPRYDADGNVLCSVCHPAEDDSDAPNV